MCKILGYCCSLIYYAIASVGLFGLKLYVECQNQGSWNECELGECAEKYMWYDLFGSMLFVGPIFSVLSMANCGFNWWRLLSFGISITITIAQILSVCGCCLTRKKHKGKSKKKQEQDEKKRPINTDVEV
eukprot:UN00017